MMLLLLQSLDLTTMRWSVAGNFPLAVWGQCTVLLNEGRGLGTTGGWTDFNTRESMRSTFILDLTSSQDSSSSLSRSRSSSSWKKFANMGLGRATHACLATTYKVKKDYSDRGCKLQFKCTVHVDRILQMF
jgi:hypothetical protein